MFGISWGEVMVVGLVAFLILGPDKLPEAARTIGRAYGRLNRLLTEAREAIKSEIDLTDLKQQGDQLKAELKQQGDQLKAELEQQGDQLKDDMGLTALEKQGSQLKVELKQQGNQFKAGLEQQGDQLKAEMGLTALEKQESRQQPEHQPPQPSQPLAEPEDELPPAVDSPDQRA